MPSKKQFTQIVLAIFFATQYFFSLYPTEIPITQIKNLASVLKPEYEYLSPIHGAIFCHNNYIENLYRYGKEEDRTIKLIKKLFFVHHDNVTFDRTYLGTNIATHFSPQDIGQIIAEIENFKNNLRSKITYSKKGKPILPPKKIIIELSNNFKNKIKDILENIEITQKKEIKKSIISYLETTIARKQEEVKTLTGDEKTKIDKKITELNQQEKKEKASDEIALKDFKISKENFIRFLTQAIPEDGDKYIQHHTTYILLAFLWKKVADKNDFLDYFKALSNTLKPFKPGIPTSSQPSIFTNKDFLSTETEHFLNSTFTSEDYKKIINQSESEITSIINNDFETLALLYLGFDLFENPLPKEIRMSSATYIDNNNLQTSFPDCGETSLRNFLNAVLYNPLTRTFDLEQLKNLNVSMDSKLYKFYDKYKTAANIHTSEAHNDWANVVSGLPEILYRENTNCNISGEGGIKNMLTVLNHLIPITSTENPKPSLKGLQEKLNSINIETYIEEKYIDETNNFGKITFNFTFKRQNLFTINWIFKTGHFQIEYPSQANINHAKKFQSSILQSLKLVDAPYQIAIAIVFLRNYNYPINDILEIIKNTKNPTQYNYPILFIQDLHTSEKILAYIESLVNKDTILDTTSNIIKKLYAQLPENDTYIQKQFFDHISNNTNIFNLFINKEFIDKLSETQKTIILTTILTTTTVSVLKYDKLIDEILPTITDDWNKTTIIESILKAEPSTTRYQWIKNNLLKTTNDRIKTKIIELILYKRIPTNPETAQLISILYQAIEKSLLTITDDWTKDNIIKSILTKETPNDPKQAQQLLPLYQWIKDNLPKITNDDQAKIEIIESILNKRIPTNPETATLFVPLYQTIKEILPTIEDDQAKIEIIELILYKRIPTNPETAILFAPLYQTIKEILPTITDDWNKKGIIESILKKEIPTNHETAILFVPLYQAIKEVLSTITNTRTKTKIIESILKKEIPSNPKLIENLQNFYQWIKDDFPTIEDDWQKTNIVQSILNKEIPTNPETATLFIPLYQAIKEILSTITNNWNKKDIIESILNKEIPSNPETATLFVPLYPAIKEILSTITDDQAKIKIIESILKKEIPSNPKIAKHFVLLYQEVKKILPTIKNEYNKYNFIKIILNKEIPDNPEFIEFLQSFYQWIQDTLPTITNSYIKKDTIKTILNKEIPTNPEKTKLFTLLYQTIAELPPLPTDLQKQFDSQKTRLEEILATLVQ